MVALQIDDTANDGSSGGNSRGGARCRAGRRGAYMLSPRTPATPAIPAPPAPATTTTMMTMTTTTTEAAAVTIRTTPNFSTYSRPCYRGWHLPRHSQGCGRVRVTLLLLPPPPLLLLLSSSRGSEGTRAGALMAVASVVGGIRGEVDDAAIGAHATAACSAHSGCARGRGRRRARGVREVRQAARAWSCSLAAVLDGAPIRTQGAAIRPCHWARASCSLSSLNQAGVRRHTPIVQRGWK